MIGYETYLIIAASFCTPIVYAKAKKSLDKILMGTTEERMGNSVIPIEIKKNTNKIVGDIYKRSKRIIGVSGELYYLHYSDNHIIDCIKEGIVKNDLKLKLTFGPNIYIKNTNFLRLALQYPKNIVLKRRKERRSNHFKYFITKEGNEYIQIDYPHEESVLPESRGGIIFFQDHP